MQRPMGGTIRTSVDYWPSFVDILMTVLMVFVLQNLVQTSLNVTSIEAAKIRQAQQLLQNALDREFSSEIAAGTVSVVRGVNLLQIRFSDKILFTPQKADLKPEGAAIVDRCAATLGNIPSTAYDRIQIEGHTDRNEFSAPQYPRDNWELSAARALVVVSRFKRSPLLSQDRLSAAAYAGFRPVMVGDKYRADLSRRIELRVVFIPPSDRKATNQ
jgi:flagellar motor protein MotB